MRKIILFFFLAVLCSSATSVEANTVFESSGDGGTVTTDFNCGTSLCRGQQMYVNRTEDLPVGITYNRMRIYSDIQPLVYLYKFSDSGFSRKSCQDTTCVSDDVYIEEIATTITTVASGIYDLTFTNQENFGTGNYLSLNVDPNTPYQTVVFQKATNGTIENGFNENRESGSIKYQLCFNTCDDYGQYSQLNSLQFNDNYLTRFITGDVTGTSRTNITFNPQIFLNVSEFTLGNRPDYINVSIYTDTVGNPDTLFFNQNSLILPLEQGTSTKNILVDESHPNGNYVAYLTFKNIQNNIFTFNKTGLVIRYTTTGSGVTSYTVEVVTDATTDDELQYEDCSSIFDVGCGVRNALMFLFVPTGETNDDMGTILLTMESKIPFSYIFLFEEMVSTIPTETDPPTIQLTLFEQDIEVIATSTYKNLIGSTGYDAFYVIATAGIYLALGVALWDLRKKLFS